ncbi:ABC transporter substrate-binding protein [Telmatospirillum sp. J64-1]|uniref:ABC transporter substrate-binding protein n=1 Tax=Telmatospirillum sp. J64-1 TaxID=2502183 RepID=UPI00115D6766|nr:ABC transporter substrate-binding protein [Telmatospirillum sp. J64-1]
MVRLFGVLLGVMLAAAAPSARAQPVLTLPEDHMVIIGFVSGLGGTSGIYSQDIYDGLRLGLRQLQDRLGGMDAELIAADDRSDPEVAAQAVRRLIERDAADIIVAGGDPATLPAILEVAAAYERFVLVANHVSEEVAGEGCNPFLFGMLGRIGAADEIMGRFLQGQGYRNVYLLAPDNVRGETHLAAFRRGYTGDLADTVVTRRGQMEFGQELRALRQANPEAVYTVHGGGQAVELVRQYYRAGLRDILPLFGTWTTFDRTTLPAMGDAALDIYDLGPWARNLEYPSNQKFITDFESQYSRLPSSMAAVGYDTAMLIETAVRSINGQMRNVEAFRTALRRADFASVRGNFRFDSNHQPVQDWYLRQVVRNEQGKIVNEMRSVVAAGWRDPQAERCALRWTLPPQPQTGSPARR